MDRHTHEEERTVLTHSAKTIPDVGKALENSNAR